MATRTPRVRLASGTDGDTGARAPLDEQHLLALRLALLEQLPRHLDPAELLQHFFKTVAASFGLARLCFQAAADVEPVVCGQGGRHSSDYQLSVERTELGQLLLYRRSRFSEPVLAQLEALIGTLVWPLRGALLYQQALNLAMRDSLTGLGNRTAMTMTLNREIALARRQQTPLSLVVLDLDHFKHINDVLGHDHGDRILCEVAKLLRATCRASDGVFRFGGEEFVVALPQAPQRIAAIIAERFRQVIGDPSHWPEAAAAIDVSASIGVAALREEDDAETLFRRADRAMYRAKAAGRDRVECDTTIEVLRPAGQD